MPTFEPADAAYHDRARANFVAHGAIRASGAELTHVEPGRVRIELPFRDDLSQQHGFFHAGISCLIADTAGGIAALTLFDANSDVLTVEFKMNLFAPANGDRLIAEAHVVRSGRTLTVCTVDVAVRKGDRETPCALMQMTLFRLDRAS